MKNRILLLVGVLFLTGFLCVIPFTRAITRDQTISTIAEKDSHVRSYYPTSNYGGQDYLIFGNYISGWSEAYLFFNFSGKPANWIEAEILILFKRNVINSKNLMTVSFFYNCLFTL